MYELHSSSLWNPANTALTSIRHEGWRVAEKETSSCAGRMWVVSTYIPHEEDAP